MNMNMRGFVINGGWSRMNRGRVSFGEGGDMRFTANGMKWRKYIYNSDS